MCDNRIPQARIRHSREHRGLNHSHHFARLRSDHGEAENAVSLGFDQRLHEAARLRCGPRSQYRDDRQLRDPNSDVSALSFDFAQSDPRQRRVGVQAIGNQPVVAASSAAGQIVANYPEVVERHVRELRAARTVADRPDISRARLESIVRRDKPSRVELDSGEVEADPLGVRDASGRNQDVAAPDSLMACRGRYFEGHGFA